MARGITPRLWTVFQHRQAWLKYKNRGAQSQKCSSVPYEKSPGIKALSLLPYLARKAEVVDKFLY